MIEKSYPHMFTSLSDVGLERDHNEDYLMFCPDISGNDWYMNQKSYIECGHIGKAGAILAIADGMGGTNAGEIASQLTCEAIKAKIINDFSPAIAAEHSRINKFLSDCIISAHHQLIGFQEKDMRTKGMGTTIITVLIINNTAYISWVGDSRCYILKPNNDFSLVSKDHSLVQEYIDAKRISEEMAFHHPQKNIITQSVGSSETPVPDGKIIKLEPGDKLILCSDGLNGMLRDEEIRGILIQYADNDKKCCQKLVDAANNAGGYDNTSIVMYRKNGNPASYSSKTTSESSTSQFYKKLIPFKKWFLNPYPIAVLILTIALLALGIAFIYKTRNTNDAVKKEHLEENASPKDDSGTLNQVSDQKTPTTPQPQSLKESADSDNNIEQSKKNDYNDTTEQKPSFESNAHDFERKGDSLKNISQLEGALRYYKNAFYEFNKANHEVHVQRITIKIKEIEETLSSPKKRETDAEPIDLNF